MEKILEIFLTPTFWSYIVSSLISSHDNLNLGTLIMFFIRCPTKKNPFKLSEKRQAELSY